MMPAAKHGDPQLGVDIHLCVVPPSPSPVPLPTPHISIVFDPMDYVPFIGATVTVCGMKRAVAGTAGIAIHIPPGFPFAPKLPDKDDEIFMGSATVDADGDPFSFLGVPVLACQVVGMPSPPRPKRKGGPRAMLLPTVFNLAIPTTVFVGGPPTISLMGMAFKFGLALLGKLAKSRFAKALGQRFQAWRKAKFGHLNPGFLKCKILRAEPVNIVTGAVSVEQSDFDLPGLIPVGWNRRYASDNKRRGAAGTGWETPADARLEFEPETGIVLFHHPEAPLAIFPSAPAAPGDAGAVMELMDGAMLSDQGDAFAVRTKEDRIYRFPKAHATMAADGVREVPLGLVEDLCGNTLFYERDAARRLVAIREWSGRRIEIDWSPGGFISRVSLHVPETGFRHVYVEYEQDRAGDLVAVRDALGNPYRFAYEAHHMVRHTDRNGLSFHYAFDRAPGGWRVVKSWGDGGLYAYKFEYLDAAMERRITDSLGHVSVVTLDERGLPVSEVDPLGGKTVFEYDEAGRTSAVVDQDGHRTEYAFDERGNLTKLVRADGSVEEMVFNNAGKPAVTIDANGNRWIEEWDAAGLLRRQCTPEGAVTRYDYDSRGRLVAVVNPRGHVTRIHQDESSVVMTSPGGRNRSLHYGELGTLLREDDETGTTFYRYDPKSRLVAAQRPCGQLVELAYDGEDNPVLVAEQAAGTTRYTYRGLGTLASVEESDGTRVDFLRDTEERLIGMRQSSGGSVVVRRDPLGRVVEECDRDGRVVRATYSPGGTLIAVADAAGTTVLDCDSLGRVVRRQYPDGDEEFFRYDGIGNVIEAVNGAATVTRAYNGDGRLVRETLGDAFEVTSAYDACGNRIERCSSLGGVVRLGFDPDNELATLEIDGQPVLSIRNEWAPTRRLTDGSANGWMRERSFDRYGRLTGLEVTAKGIASIAIRYAYDPAGNLAARADHAFGTQTFRYDAAGRAVSTHRQATTGPATMPPPVFDGDARTWTFDAAGRLTSDGSRDFAWNGAGRLVSADMAGSQTSFAYDAFGRRISKRTGDRVDHFHWDAETLLGEVRHEGGKHVATREHIFVPRRFEPLAMRYAEGQRTEIFLCHNDPNGSPVGLTRTDGSLAWAATYDTSGRAHVRVGGDLTNLRLQGQYFDQETGLHYNYFRYYSPARGTFISPDPLGIVAGLDPYAFAPNTLGWVDPLGLRCGRVALDNNAIIALLEGNRFDRRAILQAIGNRRPVIPQTALREFLNGGGNRAALQRFLARTEGEIVRDANSAMTRRMMARGLAENDARIVATARRQGVDLLTRDNEVLRRVPDVARIF